MVGERFMSMDPEAVRDRVGQVFDEMFVQHGVNEQDLQKLNAALVEGTVFTSDQGHSGSNKENLGE